MVPGKKSQRDKVQHRRNRVFGRGKTKYLSISMSVPYHAIPSENLLGVPALEFELSDLLKTESRHVTHWLVPENMLLGLLKIL